MGIFEDDFGIDINGTPVAIRNAIIGYKKSCFYPDPLVLVLPRLDFDKKADDKEDAFKRAEIALYPKSQYFNYDKAAYLGSLISLNNEISEILVFIHAELIDDSECRKDWEILVANLMMHRPIHISDELTITRPENELTVIVCTEKPSFLTEGTSIKYHCIDLSDENPDKEESEKEYNGYADLGNNYVSKPGNPKHVTVTDSIAHDKNPVGNGALKGKNIDWEERRYEILKTIINGRLARSGNTAFSFDDASLNKMIGEANKVIKRLKERLNDEAINCSE